MLQDGQLITGSIYENIVIASSATNKEQYREKVKRVKQQNCLLETFQKSRKVILVLNISNDCNMKCAYCYANGGNYSEKIDMMTTKTDNFYRLYNIDNAA